MRTTKHYNVPSGASATKERMYFVLDLEGENPCYHFRRPFCGPIWRVMGQEAHRCLRAVKHGVRYFLGRIGPVEILDN
jgi:hypothetical protein